MKASLPSITKEAIQSLLLENKKAPGKPYDLEELERDNDGRTRGKRCFRLQPEKGIPLHLTVAINLEDLYKRSIAFHRALPQHSCKPCFLERGKDFQIFAQEFFEGIPIDEQFAKGNLSSLEIATALRKLRQSLYGNLRTSTTKQARQELDALKAKLHSIESFSDLDRKLLDQDVIPRLWETLAHLPPLTRWSSGDMAARNLLINNTGEIRLIDCEFAHETHYHDEDWLRLGIFSSSPFKDLQEVVRLQLNLSPAIEAYFWLRQITLEKQVHEAEEFRLLARHHICKCQEILVATSEKKFQTDSLVVDGLNHCVSNARTALRNTQEAHRKTGHRSEEIGTETIVENHLTKAFHRLLPSNRRIRKRLKVIIKHPSSKFFKWSNGIVRLSGAIEDALGPPVLDIRVRIGKRLIPCVRSIRVIPSSTPSEDLKCLAEFDVTFRLSQGFKLLQLEVQTDDRKWLVPWGSIYYSRGLHASRRKYADWVKLYDSEPSTEIPSLRTKPLISILTPVRDPNPKWLLKAIDSVRKQSYANWELCLVDDASTKDSIREKLLAVSKTDDRIKLRLLDEPVHISRATNHALGLATGDFISFLDHDDMLAPHALASVASEINAYPQAQVIYTDEDKIDEQGQRSSPHFKPDWNPELLLSQNYVCHFLVMERKLVEQIDGLRAGIEGAQDWDLLLRAEEQIAREIERDGADAKAWNVRIRHIPKILYHWRSNPSSTAMDMSSKPYLEKNTLKMLEDCVSRRNLRATVSSLDKSRNHWSMDFEVSPEKPLVSIIIPTKDQLQLLESCISSIQKKTTYPNYEIIVIDHESKQAETKEFLSRIIEKRVQVVPFSGPFNYSSINNYGTTKANGELYTFLNNDTEIIDGNWLGAMVAHAMRPQIGCVGTKLLFPDSTVQHAGVILGFGGVAGHMFKGFPHDAEGYMSRLKLRQNLSAVTAACMMTRAEVFHDLGGFDACNLPVAFNDVDFCIRATEAGYRNLYLPEVTLIHKESASRGSDDSPEKLARFTLEIEYMKRRWGELLQNDPAYNPNLSLYHEDFSLACPPRAIAS